MTKTDLQTIFASQIEVGVATIYFMLYESDGNGGTKCEMSSGSLTDLDALTTALADYTYVDPKDSPISMATFVSKDCTVAVTPVLKTQIPTITSQTVSAGQMAAAQASTIVQPTITGTVTKDDGTTSTVTSEGTTTPPETTTAADSTTAASTTDTTTASTAAGQDSTTSAS
jgi:hypothetical protein